LWFQNITLEKRCGGGKEDKPYKEAQGGKFVEGGGEKKRTVEGGL